MKTNENRSKWHFYAKNERCRTLRIYEDEDLKVTLCGGIFGLSNGIANYSVLDICHSVLEHSMAFDDIHGYYKIVVYDKTNETYWFWTDNQGSQRFYIDFEEHTVSDSFLLLKQQRKELLPNYYAIAQLLSADYILSDDTIVQGIMTTAWDKFYWYRGAEFGTENKNLRRLSKNQGEELHTIIVGLLKAFPKEKAAVCTGGTDSRTILAHLSSLGEKLPLLITGHKDNPDLVPAQTVADTLGLHLDVFDPSYHEENWLEEGFEFSDGQFNPVNSYRQMKKCQIVEEKNCYSEWGGVGGEYYKNYYCRFRHWGNSDWKVGIRSLFGKLLQQYNWMGERLQKERDNIKNAIDVLVAEACKERYILCAYNAAGFQTMVKIASNITAGYANDVVKVDPLFERSVIAKASKTLPAKHSMAIWQRKEIHKYQPSLSDLKRDTGETCTVNPLYLNLERLKNLNDRVATKVRKLIKKLLKQKTKAEPQYWNNDYADARKTASYEEAVEICRSLGVISSSAALEDIPLKYTGTILLIGMTFKKV